MTCGRRGSVDLLASQGALPAGRIRCRAPPRRQPCVASRRPVRRARQRRQPLQSAPAAASSTGMRGGDESDKVRREHRHDHHPVRLAVRWRRRQRRGWFERLRRPGRDTESADAVRIAPRRVGLDRVPSTSEHAASAWRRRGGRGCAMPTAASPRRAARSPRAMRNPARAPARCRRRARRYRRAGARMHRRPPPVAVGLRAISSWRVTS